MAHGKRFSIVLATSLFKSYDYFSFNGRLQLDEVKDPSDRALFII